ncbi:MAG: AMIN domain-containing protein, partial [Deltaproteobacteria bacterium]|nr:AMIN domain-containing protein [Deltaproteobacteria bacterium]
MADRSLRTILCLMALSVVCWDGSASATDTVTEVKMSPDLRRVIMKSSGKIANHNAFQLDRPPRLVIEIPGVSPGKVPKSSRAEHNGGVKIDVSESKSGTHVVLDFGGAPVPQYHIRRMDAYLIVFLEDWRPPQGPAAPRSASNHKSGKTTSTVAMTERNKSAIPAEEHRSDVIIKSAEVVDGLMVLVVADKMRPERLYRIDLGVNFQLRGFVCAEIHSLPPGTGPAPSPESGSEVSGEVMPSGPKRGPTKAAGPVRMTASQGRNEPRTEWYTPATTLRGLAF